MAHADDDEDWDAVIARAKMQLALPKASSQPPPPARRRASLEIQETPPPLTTPKAPTPWTARPAPPRAAAPVNVRAKLDTLVWGGMKKPPTPRPPLTGRRAAEEDPATPPPVPKARPGAGPIDISAKRPLTR